MQSCDYNIINAFYDIELMFETEKKSSSILDEQVSTIDKVSTHLYIIKYFKQDVSV